MGQRRPMRRTNFPAGKGMPNPLKVFVLLQLLCAQSKAHPRLHKTNVCAVYNRLTIISTRKFCARGKELGES